ncbi:hypothetical protein A1O3_04187 [Capronia epimyces CBS 606.96]|uniref:Transcription factor domain-containing protein n=1 Tax=Capronia epimyces CBS 606.96 TaxID=1182542 RepID=W9Y3Y3_9EURO|nr:uncharacterized protein A1O3_04187 [Capronia epimyces CBS 606.96]EXJ87228.1 hypothetical protein A1O3_04187 [Capronia epimyces CBS 606.96]
MTDKPSADLDSDIILRPTRLFTELDACIAEDREAGQSHVGSSMSPSPSRQELDRQIDVSLRHAIRSFAARWLHLVPQAEPFVPPHQCIVRELWRASRRDMLKVINRVSYRSVLTLFLFGLTPIPVGVSEEEEMDGLTGQICVQTALQQVQRLRERQRNYQFNGSKVSLGPDVSMSMSSSPAPTPSSNITSTFLSAESRAYWGALIFDTSASLTLNFRSSLTSGLHGVGTESSWQALKMGAGSFHTRTEEWRRGSVELTEDMVKQVIAAASAGNLYLLKMIAVLKEALREGYEEKKLAGAWTCALEALDMFKVTFLPLLRLCQRRLRFLGQVERLNWYELMLHHFLGILLLIDGIEAADRSDLLSQLTETRADAEREILNTLQFGLDSTYLVHGVHHTNTVTNTVTNTNTNTNTSTNTSTNSLLGNNPLSGNTDTNPLLGNTNTNPLSGVQSTNTNTNTNTNPLSGALGNFALSRSSVLSASFVAIDPFPHHVVAAVQLMHKVVSREYDQRRITLDTCQRLTSTLLQALEHAPQTSKSVDAARQELSGELEILMSGRRR